MASMKKGCLLLLMFTATTTVVLLYWRTMNSKPQMATTIPGLHFGELASNETQTRGTSPVMVSNVTPGVIKALANRTGNVTLVVVILSQAHNYHIAKANKLRLALEKELAQEDKVYLSHEEWPFDSAWTILPIIPDILHSHNHAGENLWLLFLEDETDVWPDKLKDLLQGFNPNEPWFLGRASADETPSVIHQYIVGKSRPILYPDVSTGFCLNWPALERLERRLKAGTSTIPNSFVHDPIFELAYYMNTKLTNVSRFCSWDNLKAGCATKNLKQSPQCGGGSSKTYIHFAVKICERLIERVSRSSLIWIKNVTASMVSFYTDVAPVKQMRGGKLFGQDVVIVGRNNTSPVGGCGRLYIILQHFVNDPRFLNTHWLLIADDNTLISVKRLNDLLRCYEGDGPVVLGKRWGHGMTLGNKNAVTYPTGGAGIAINKAAAERIVHTTWIQCEDTRAADDYTLGVWLKLLAIPVINSEAFHQAEPHQYPIEHLKRVKSVSFHPYNKANVKWDTDEWRNMRQVSMNWLNDTGD
ncbi:unnamed protein product [Owenia fusiformis]|uniref:Fringe-like glycosyltransferase domain-containing protein n=1 Tax=Owenia fusiformis TaxID=6347 RepID=A0A8S4Q6I5_OWEFU|nr:unnamed protein product [Owenia fusiformis]